MVNAFGLPESLTYKDGLTLRHLGHSCVFHQKLRQHALAISERGFESFGINESVFNGNCQVCDLARRIGNYDRPHDIETKMYQSCRIKEPSLLKGGHVLSSCGVLISTFSACRSEYGCVGFTETPPTSIMNGRCSLLPMCRHNRWITFCRSNQNHTPVACLIYRQQQEHSQQQVLQSILQ